NDKTLTSAPAYQNSTFGSYYLPTSTLLYKAGSRSPVEAGLYHYTTRFDQMKIGDDTANPYKVSIGLHYVAAASGTPKDANNNGIPDWVEDGDGDGVFNDGDMLDDYDLDADGLDLWQEQHLGLNPNVADNPLRIESITTDPEDPAVIRVSVSVASGFTANFLSLEANVKHFGPNPSAFDFPNQVSFLAETWDLMDNGQYQSDDEFDIEIVAYYPDKAAAQNNAPGSRTVSKSKRKAKDNTLSDWPGQAGWIITYLDFMQDANTGPFEHRLNH